jgi:hypothetical protein
MIGFIAVFLLYCYTVFLGFGPTDDRIYRCVFVVFSITVLIF